MTVSFTHNETSSQYYETFLGVIYATSGVFPCGFDWVYADSNVITSKNIYNSGHGDPMYSTLLST
jgi:hypothetical protein